MMCSLPYLQAWKHEFSEKKTKASIHNRFIFWLNVVGQFLGEIALVSVDIQRDRVKEKN